MRDELTLAGEAARQAGAVVLKYYGGAYEVRNKSAHDSTGPSPAAGGVNDNPVTSADLEADACIKDLLRMAYPDYGWLSEETADDPTRLGMSSVWIVDPIDGTKEFVEGIPEFVVSIALVEDGVPSVAAMYNPATEDLFLATRGGGSFLNGRRIFCTESQDLQTASMIVSRSETKRGEIAPFLLHLGEIRPVGSVAYKLALVAAGQADLNISVQPKSEWDVCAGDLLVREAGGQMLDLNGKTPIYNQNAQKIDRGLVAGNRTLTQKILDLANDIH